MKFLIPLLFLVAMASPVKAANPDCGFLADAYLEYAKPFGESGKSMLESGIFMG